MISAAAITCTFPAGTLSVSVYGLAPPDHPGFLPAAVQLADQDGEHGVSDPRVLAHACINGESQGVGFARLVTITEAKASVNPGPISGVSP